jgi:hypothetical protein
MTPAQKYVEENPLIKVAARLAELKRQYQERDAAYPVKPEQRTIEEGK